MGKKKKEKCSKLKGGKSVGRGKAGSAVSGRSQENFLEKVTFAMEGHLTFQEPMNLSDSWRFSVPGRAPFGVPWSPPSPSTLILSLPSG